MKQDTRTALEKSIEHWYRITHYGEISEGSDNCALCKKFNPCPVIDDDDDCEGCPVAEKVGVTGCNQTPYNVFTDYCDDYRMKHKVFNFKSKQLAQNMLNFLKSLLPEVENE